MSTTEGNQPKQRTPLPVDPRYARKREIDQQRPTTRRQWWAVRKAADAARTEGQ